MIGFVYHFGWNMVSCNLNNVDQWLENISTIGCDLQLKDGDLITFFGPTLDTLTPRQGHNSFGMSKILGPLIWEVIGVCVVIRLQTSL